jgi:SAM-dependent methyltransferase
MTVPSLLRLEEHRALSQIELSGRVLDLGGDKKSGYLDLFKGQFEATTVNLNEGAQPDIIHDLEKPLPVADASYDHVLLINVLEHIFDYRALLSEAKRVTRPGGSIVIVVPFLFPVHPSPEDYHRFTASALRKECKAAGLKVISMEALGHGVFSARYVLLDRLLPKLLRMLSFYSVRYITYGVDALFTSLAKALGKKYDPREYALGYCLVART